MSHAIADILTTSGITTLTTTVAALSLGAIENGKPAAPLNATSHIVWGDSAANYSDFDLSHTLLGGVLNAGAMLSWAAVHRGLFPKPKSLFGALGSGVTVAAMAYVTDYYLVPKRFTPGFEKRVSGTALATMYGVLAASLAVSAVLRRD